MKHPHRVPFALALLLLGDAAGAQSYDPSGNGALYDRVVSEVDGRYWDKSRLGPDWAVAVECNRDRALAARGPQQLYAAVQATLATLHDSHVFAIGPGQVTIDRDREQGVAASSFGFSFWHDGPAWKVLGVHPDSPAARSGVRIGWQLVRIDGTAVEPDFRSSLDHDSRLSFLDEFGHTHDVVLRGTVLPPEPERRARRLPGDILVLALDVFAPHADRWVSEALAEGPPPQGVILDLRENEGGDADAIARVAGRFFLEKHILLRRTRRDGFEDVPIAGAGRRAYAGPLAVLVGPRSASGAEAVAAMIDESGRGVTLGERTSGALTGASEVDLPDGGRLSVAVFDIRTPSGARIEGQGFTPRIVVQPTLLQLRAGQDPALDRAVLELRAEDGAPPPLRY